MTKRADDTFRHLEKSSRSHEHAAERAFYIAGNPQWQVEAKGDPVCVGKFNLVEIATGPQDSEIGNNAAAGADESERFFGRKLSLLVEPFMNRELVAFAEEGFDSFRSEMAVTGANINYQRVGGGRSLRQCFAKALIDSLSNEVFDHGAVR